jgi:putative DNA methylase
VGKGEEAVLKRGKGEEAVLKRKLIEVALPLETINRESSRENYIYKGNPSSVHKWWAQRPLAAARAVLFAQLVDDPSAHPDRFPAAEDQQVERERLHGIIERLVVWENVNDKRLLAEAHEEILKSTGGEPPPILDPFAGGGTIPLEAQRLGLEAHAADLNPVAVLIEKALIEIPPKFANREPIYPGLADSEMAGWTGARGLAADVRAYGKWVGDMAEERIGRHYPEATLPDGTSAPVIAWLWARTVTCPNPACEIEMPLVRSWWLGRKKGREAYLIPRIVADSENRGGQRVEFDIGHGATGPPDGDRDGTVDRNGARCVACGTVAPLKYVREKGCAGQLRTQLLSSVVQVDRKRVYLPSSEYDSRSARAANPTERPEGMLPAEALGFRVQGYGITSWAELFTDRQLLALTAFSELVREARERVFRESAAAEYADAVATYLAFALCKLADYGNSLAVWYPKEDRPKNLFALQSIPMVWDFPEVNPFSGIGGAWTRCLKIVTEAFQDLDSATPGFVYQQSADKQPRGALISTDPPYYDNIGYSDLSDFFYVWLRRTLREFYPELLSTMLVPKAEELVANPYRHGGAEGAKHFFEESFRKVFARARENALDDFPITVYYAFKQSDSDEEGEASTGWETLLDGMIRSGWTITATWPMRSERGGRTRDVGSNALASSIVLALRPRPDDAVTTDRRELIAALQNELPDSLRELQQGRIAPVDLPQAAIGPGMAVFSRYAAVIEADGSPMSVRSALARINEILDQVLNEQEGDFDSTTRFAIAWYRQHGYKTGKFGDANNLANARNTTVEAMDRGGILTSAAGKVTLLAPAELPADYDPTMDEQISVWEILHHMIATLERGGIAEAAQLLAAAGSRTDSPIDGDLVKELAFLLFSLAEKNGWTQDALAFNTLATAWPEIIDAARDRSGSTPEQATFELGDA